MRGSRRLDAETLDVLRDEPELLAIAEAVRATQGSRHHVLRSPRAALSVATAATAALGAAAILWLGSSGSEGLLPRAQAAAGPSDAVLRMTFALSESHASLRIVMNPVANTAAVTVIHRGRVQNHASLDLAADDASSPERVPFPVGRELIVVAATYREALRDGRAISATRPAGSKLSWLLVRVAPGFRYRVAIDPYTGAMRSVVIRSRAYRVLAYEDSAGARFNG